MGVGVVALHRRSLKKYLHGFPHVIHLTFQPSPITQDVGAKIVDPEIQVTGIAYLWSLRQHGRQFILPNICYKEYLGLRKEIKYGGLKTMKNWTN